LTGEGAEQVRTLVTRGDVTLKLVVDLTEMMFIDAIGEEVLLFAKKLDAEFIAETAYSRDVCERLGLPLIKPQQSSQWLANKDGNGHPPANNPRRR
jgi:hypothetical protein